MIFENTVTKMNSGYRVYPAKIIFVIESNKYDIVFDLGLGVRLKSRVVVCPAFSAPCFQSTNKDEVKSARLAKMLVMDNFMGLDGFAIVEEGRVSNIMHSFLVKGTTCYEEPQKEIDGLGLMVDMVSYLETMRAFDFAKTRDDFSSVNGNS